MYETSIITPARHDAHPQDRSDEARRSCDVEVLGAAPDPGGRNLRHARKRRALARPVGDAVGRCRREVARACRDARHGVPPRPPRVSTCRRLARGEADLLDAYVRDACPRRGSREIEGDGRDRNDIRRWRCRSRERSLGMATGAMSGSHRMPAADRAGSPPETSSREGLGGHRRVKQEIGDDSPLLARQAARRAGRDTGLRRAVPRRADRREVPPLSGRGRRRKADGTRPRGPSGSQVRVAIGCDGRGRSHSSRLGPGKPGEPGTRAAYAGHIQRGSHPARDMERSHEALVREPGLTGEARDPRRTRTLPDKEDPPRGASEPCYLPGLFPSSHSGFDRARSGGVSRPVPRDDEPSRREDGEGCPRARPRNVLRTCAEVPRVLPKEDQLKGNSVLLGTHNQQRRILKEKRLFGVFGGWHGLGRTVSRTPSGSLGYHPVVML